MAGTIVSLDEARTTRRKNSDSHAPSGSKFIIQHTWPCRYQLVDAGASSIVAEFADFAAARAERDRLNASAPYRLGAEVAPRNGCLAGTPGVIVERHAVVPLQSVRVRFDSLAGAVMWFFTEDLEPAGSAS